CHKLFLDGTFQLPSGAPPSVERLRGIVNHIYYVKNLHDERVASQGKKSQRAYRFPLKGIRKVYYQLLFYQNFASPDHPLILCEGKTDSIYLRLAIKNLHTKFPNLISKSGKELKSSVRYFNYGRLAHSVLHLGGGTGDLVAFISQYEKLL